MLRIVAQAGPQGASPTEIGHVEQLSRSTVHRILKCLVDEGLLERDDDGRRYRMGPLIHELSLLPAPSALEVVRWRPVVEAVARRTGVTAYLMRRSGLEAVCLIKVDGDSAVRFVPVEVGQRRPLGVGAGATALLAALAPEQIDEVIRMITPNLEHYPRINAASLHAAVEQVQRTGFAVSRGAVVPDGFGLGAIIPTTAGVPHLAISLAAHASAVTDAAIAKWKDTLAQAVRTGLATEGAG